MGFFSRIFGTEEAPAPEAAAPVATAEATVEVPPERQGVNGEYDQNGLAKRVTIAFDEDAEVNDIDTIWVAQTGGKVVLKGQAPQADLDRLVSVAGSVFGATGVDASQVELV